MKLLTFNEVKDIDKRKKANSATRIRKKRVTKTLSTHPVPSSNSIGKDLVCLNEVINVIFETAKNTYRNAASSKDDCVNCKVLESHVEELRSRIIAQRDRYSRYKTEFETAKDQLNDFNRLKAELEEATSKLDDMDKLKAELETATFQRDDLNRLEAELEVATSKLDDMNKLKAELETAKFQRNDLNRKIAELHGGQATA